MSRIRNLFRAVFDRPPRQNLRPKPARLRCEAMEDRDVPAAFSFTLVRGPGIDHGSGLFTAPIGFVDPAEGTQSIELTDLVVNVNGTTFTDFDAPPTANYEYGVFQGVSFELDLSSPPSGFPYEMVVVNDVGQVVETGAGQALASGATGGETGGTFWLTLPNQQTVYGTFAIDPETYEAAQSGQVPLTGLSLTIGGQTLTLADTIGPATVAYFGSTAILAFTIGRDALAPLPYAELEFDGDATVVPIDTVSISAYDVADTSYVFDFGNGMVGAVSFSIPWGSVDENESSQTLSLSGTVVNFNGVNFSGGDFDSTPTATFEYGELVGINFNIGTTPTGFLYSSLSMSGTTVSAVNADTEDTETCTAQAKPKVEITANAKGMANGQVDVSSAWSGCNGAANIKVVQTNAQGVPIPGGPAKIEPINVAGGKKTVTLNTTVFNGNIYVVVQVQNAAGGTIASSAVKEVQTK